MRLGLIGALLFGGGASLTTPDSAPRNCGPAQVKRRLAHLESHAFIEGLTPRNGAPGTDAGVGTHPREEESMVMKMDSRDECVGARLASDSLVVVRYTRGGA